MVQGSHIKSIGDAFQSSGVVSDVVPFRDLGCGVTEQVGNLAWGELPNGAIGLFQ